MSILALQILFLTEKPLCSQITMSVTLGLCVISMLTALTLRAVTHASVILDIVEMASTAPVS